MAETGTRIFAALLEQRESEILKHWVERLKAEGLLGSGRIKEGELNEQARGFLRELKKAVGSGATDLDGPAYAALRDRLARLSTERAMQGFSPRETAVFVFSLKQPLFDALSRDDGSDAAAKLDANMAIGVLLDRLGLFTIEAFQKTRESIIVRQEQELTELSTPVIKLWEGILALPLIGTIDSQRTQAVMENLLEAIVAQNVETAIIDITGVPTVDTLTAQHLLKTIAAARLMGADCIISGIRPQIAQTMVHLGVELDVISKATLADAFALALAKQGRAVVRKRRDSGAHDGANNGRQD